MQPSSTQMPAGLSDSTSTRKQLGIGERAILLQTDAGNVMWDMVAWIDDGTVDFIKSKGGLEAIVISHPHFYTTHLEWARIFGCPIYLCEADKEWLVPLRRVLNFKVRVNTVQESTTLRLDRQVAT